MPINSKQKGVRGERMWRDVCRSHGFFDIWICGFD